MGASLREHARCFASIVLSAGPFQSTLLAAVRFVHEIVSNNEARAEWLAHFNWVERSSLGTLRRQAHSYSTCACLRGGEARTRTCHLPPRANALPADPIRERQSPMQPSPASGALTATQPSLYIYIC